MFGFFGKIKAGLIWLKTEMKYKKISKDVIADCDQDDARLAWKRTLNLPLAFSDDYAEAFHRNKYRYRECLINIESVKNIENAKFDISDGENDIHYICADENTIFLDVNEPGEYRCIYKYSDMDDNPVIKGKMLCIADVEQYEHFSGIKDLQDKIKNIAAYTRCSPEQKRCIVEISQREVTVHDDEPSVDRRTQRDVVTDDPETLKMMFNLCKHTLPVNLQYQCMGLIHSEERRNTNESSMILADILYTCCEPSPKKPFMSTQECMQVFKKRRYGDDPWIKDIIRQIRLLDRCDHSGAVFVLVGPPGTGKTEIAEAIAECTGKKFCVVKCGNKNSMEIGGSHKTYADSCHGEIQENLLYYGNDCCMLLDEFEKMVITEKEGNPFNLFISTFDDRKTFTDSFTKVPVPTKDVIWILTVNTVDSVPEYILNRFQENVFVLDPYSSQTKAEISKEFIIPKYMKTYHFGEQEVRFTDDALVAIAKSTSDGGVRVTSQKIEKLLSYVNEKIEEGCQAPVIVDTDFALTVMNEQAKTVEDKRRRIGY